MIGVLRRRYDLLHHSSLPLLIQLQLAYLLKCSGHLLRLIGNLPMIKIHVIVPRTLLYNVVALLIC